MRVRYVTGHDYSALMEGKDHGILLLLLLLQTHCAYNNDQNSSHTAAATQQLFADLRP